MKTIILHGHIFKNAGTTFDWSLQRMFGDHFLAHRQEELMLQEGQTHLMRVLDGNEGLKAISSHHLPQVPSTLGELRLRPAYLLRHPLSRIQSVYRFERQQVAETPGARAAKALSFRDYVEWRMRPEVMPVVRNYQTRYLAGVHTLLPEGASLSRVFLDAIPVVEREPLVGLVERYDETMVLFEETLAEAFPGIDLAYIPQNVSSEDESTAGDEEGALEQVLESLGRLQKTVIDGNCYDLALYGITREHFESRLSSIDRLEEKLAEFRERCRLLRQSSGSPSSLKQWPGSV
jgi:hypothetical protein